MNLKSPHLVSVFDVKTAGDGTPFVVMEYVAGPSLRDLLNDSPEGLGPDKAAFFLREIAKGLATSTATAWSTATSSPRTFSTKTAT